MAELNKSERKVRSTVKYSERVREDSILYQMGLAREEKAK